MNEITAYENNRQLFNYASDVAKEYGLFSKVVVKESYTGKTNIYLVFGIDPISDDVNPVEIINRYNRSTTVFYPENFAINITGENPLLVWENIISYVTNAEFMCELYEEFQVPLPKKIRVDELSALVTFYCGRENSKYDMDTRKDYAKGLREFFKQETPKSKFRKAWKEFYRSNLFAGDKSFIRNFFIFRKRKEPEVKLEVLLASNHELKKTYIPEHYYDEFHKTIKEKYPDVKYHISEKQVVDKGKIVDPNTNLAVKTQFGLTVTDKQYDKMCERRFATEGFSCLEGLNVSYYEGRDIFYIASDENIIASVLNTIRLRWAKCSSIDVLRERGKIEGVDIPYSQMKNFYVGMKEFDIPFVVDTSVNGDTCLGVVRVLYSTEDADIVGKLSAGLTLASITISHVHAEDIPFGIDIERVNDLLQNAKNKKSEGADETSTAEQSAGL